jgi:CelD/BcsL family acetyltransferase involved in cellulose biosynthesis
MSDAELISDLAGMQALAPEWDALALAAGNPVAAPAWVIAWWRHVAAPDADPLVVALRDHGTLVGVAPFYLSRARRGVREARLMSSDFGVCVQPLALPGREWELAGAIGEALAPSQPAPDLLAFGPMPLASVWTAGIHALWPGRMLGVCSRQRIEGAPVIHLREPSFEEWFASLSPKMRHGLRRAERLFEEAGGSTRWSTAATLRADAEAFAQLHAGRWAERGHSRLADLGERLPDWLEELGGALLGQGRFQMCVLELDGAPICVDFGLIAGTELAAVNTGWDERHAKLSPAKLAVLRVVRSAYEHACRRVHLGCGEMENKLRLSNGIEPQAWTVIVPPSRRLPRAYGEVLPGLLRRRARDAAERTLPAARFEALRKLKR